MAIVTGASRGIGRAVAAALVARGDQVCITARNADALDEACGELGPDAIAVVGRAQDVEHQDEAIARTLEAFGRIDLLVNNVGINPVQGRLVDLDLDVARKVLDVNLVTALSWVQKVHAAGLAAHGGAIVNVASRAGLHAMPGLGIYGASKAALVHLTSQLALELAPGVRVNAVAPAIATTRFSAALYEGREAQVLSQYPLGRLGTPEDVAQAVVFLCSDEASWITGQTLVLDGGVGLATGE